MNKELTVQIIKHIFSNLLIIPSAFVDEAKSKSIRNKEFLLDKKIPFIDEQGNSIYNRIWGCQISFGEQEIKLLLGDCSQEKDIIEYCLIFHLKDSPVYGLYLICNEDVDSEALMACTIDNNSWLVCNTYLQSTFLAGMEQIKDTGLSWGKCLNYDEELKLMLSFIKYHIMTFGEDNEG